MDTTTTTPTTATPVTPFPASDSPKPAGEAAAATKTPSDAAAATAPVLDRLIKRATTGAHDAVDSIAAKASAVAGSLQGGVDHAGETRDEWLESARDAIRQHPFAAVAGALVVGAALLSLGSSRRR